jgi:hypothetical protein
MLSACESSDYKECEWDGNEKISICTENADGLYYKCNRNGYYEVCKDVVAIEINFPCHMYEEDEKPDHCEEE